MPFYCELCHKEMPWGCRNWENFIFGLVCENHNHEDIARVVELTSAKVRDRLIDELTTKFRTRVIGILESEKGDKVD
jgi:hypothetical protein